MKRKTVPSLFFIFFIIPFTALIVLKGTVYTAFTYNSIVIAASLIFFGCFCLYNIKKKKRLVFPSLLFPVFFMLLIYLISLIPLPNEIIKYISPLSLFFNSISENSLSRITLSLPDTVYVIFRTIVFLIFMITASRFMENDESESRVKIFFIIAFIGAFNVFVSLPYYVDKEFYPSLKEFVPFINPNHFGAFSGLSAFASLVLISSAKKDSALEKILYLGMAFFIINVSGLLLSLSRGSITAFIFSMLFILIFRLIRKKHSVLSKTKRIFTVSFSFVFLSLVFLYAQDLIEDEFVSSTLSPMEKIEKASGINDYFKDFILTGSGAGSFRHIHSFYSSNPEKQFLQLENEPLQLVLETGLLPALIFCFSLIYILIKRRKKLLHSKEIYYAALFFIFIQNCVDFNLHNLSNLVVSGIFFIAVTEPYIFINRFKWKTYLIPIFSFFLVFLFFLLPFSFDFNVNIKEHAFKMRGLYPSSYLVSMNESLLHINSGNKKELLKSIPLLSETMAKSPKYIFPKILTGIVFFRLGDKHTSLQYFREALSKDDDSYANSFKIIFNELKNKNDLGFIGEIINDITITQKISNSLISNEISSSVLYEITNKRKKELFIPFCKAALALDKVDECESAVYQASNSNQPETIKEKGEIEIIKSQIADKKGEKDKALEYGKSGALKTGNFFHYYYLYFLYAKYGMYSELPSVESELRKHSMTNRKLYAYFLKAKSDVLAYEKRYRASAEQLQDAILIDKNPYWQYTLAYRLYLAGSIAESTEILRKISKIKDKELQIKIENLRKTLNEMKKKKEYELLKGLMESKNE